MWTRVAAAALLGLASNAYAQTSSKCSGDVCYALNIPENTASSGNGDIFFQISAPTSYSWVGLGQGSSMSGSHIFVMYTSADGKNVTVSPRLGTGHTMPQFTSDTQLTLIEGSGVSNGQMVGNVRCANCQSWSGGSMDFTSSSASWIYASKSGSSLNSDDTSESISQHGNTYGNFDWDFSSAKGGSSVNPFASGTATSTGGTGTQSCVPRPTSSSSSGTSTTQSGGPPWFSGRPTGSPWNNEDKRSTSDSDDGTNYCPEGTTPGSGSGSGFGSSQLGAGAQAAFERKRNMLIAHGVLASLAFVIFFPAGAISIRLFSFPGLVWFHAAVQIFAYMTFTAAVGLGVYIGRGEYLTSNHAIIGLVLFSVLFFQPIFGFLHHSLFKKYGGRTFWSYNHIWLGRGIITLGMINGGLGLLLAGNAGESAYIAYGVIAGIIWLVYVLSAVYGEVKRKRSAPPTYTGRRKGSSNSSGSPHSRGEQREFYGNKERGRP